MATKEDIQRIVYEESRYIYRLMWEDFESIQSKSNVLLIVASLIITISFTLIREEIISLTCPYSLFLSLSLMLAVFSIIIILIGLKARKIHLPNINYIFNNYEKNKPQEVLEGITRAWVRYKGSLDKVLKKKRDLINWAENFILTSIILLVLSIFPLLIR